MPIIDDARRHASQRDYDRTRRARTPSRKRSIDKKPFCGVDGEGGNRFIVDSTGVAVQRHEYTLLRAGDSVLTTGQPLGWEECLEFIAGLPRNRTYVAYYFDYDVTMILKDAPVGDLFTKKNALLPSRIGRFDVRYLPHKEFAVSLAKANKYVSINDVGSFFQQSFLTSLNDWEIGTDEERAVIEEGKKQRQYYTALTAETIRYNALEITLLEALMTEFAQVCRDVGYLPGRWQGPGWLATAMMKQHGVPRTSTIPLVSNEHLMTLANASYYGGRFEITSVGPIPGPVYEYDLNSAYPWAMGLLPCLMHGSFVRRKTRPAKGILAFGEVRFTHSVDSLLCHLPIRRKEGGLFFPREGSGVYWSMELEAAEAAGTIVESAGVWYEYRNKKKCSCKPFGYLADEFLKRKKLGGKRGKVIKLGMNSHYGKLAQSIGIPAYANPIWASLITAWTRASLIDAYRDHQADVVMIATDAVYSRAPLQVDEGSGLGQWEGVVHEHGVFVVMPGMYYPRESQGAGVSKTRGVNRGLFDRHRRDFEAAFERVWSDGEYTRVLIPMTLFITLRQAVAWKRLEDAGQWWRTAKLMSFDWSSKRARGFDRVEGYARTLPWEGSKDLMSVPYGREIGALTELRRLMNEQPDFGMGFQAP